jgi:hypothetical protein
MGNNASSSIQGSVFHGFDAAESRDLRPLFASLLDAAAEVRSYRTNGYARDRQSVRKRSLALAEAPSSSSAALSSSIDTAANPMSQSDASATQVQSDAEAVMLSTSEPRAAENTSVTPATSSMGFLNRPLVSSELLDISDKLLQGDLSDNVLRLIDRTSVRMFISCTDSGVSISLICIELHFVFNRFIDTLWERNTLVADVWPYLSRLCQILDMDFEPIDLNWNVFDPNTFENRESEVY